MPELNHHEDGTTYLKQSFEDLQLLAERLESSRCELAGPALDLMFAYQAEMAKASDVTYGDIKGVCVYPETEYLPEEAGFIWEDDDNKRKLYEVVVREHDTAPRLDPTEYQTRSIIGVLYPPDTYDTRKRDLDTSWVYEISFIHGILRFNGDTFSALVRYATEALELLNFRGTARMKLNTNAGVVVELFINPSPKANSTMSIGPGEDEALRQYGPMGD